jgi:hypothetical protein
MTEAWKPIPGYAGYEVSDRGNLRSIKTGSPRLMLQASKEGRSCVSVRRNGAYQRVYTHVAVLEAFVSPRPVNHWPEWKNGKQTDNRLANLAWVPRAKAKNLKRGGAGRSPTASITVDYLMYNSLQSWATSQQRSLKSVVEELISDFLSSKK